MRWELVYDGGPDVQLFTFDVSVAIKLGQNTPHNGDQKSCNVS